MSSAITLDRAAGAARLVARDITRGLLGLQRAALWLAALALSIVVLVVGLAGSPFLLGTSVLLQAYLISLFFPSARRLYNIESEDSWGAHIGWAISGFFFVLLACWSIGPAAQGDGTRPTDCLQAAAAAVLGITCLLHGTRAGRGWWSGSAGVRRWTSLMTVAFFALGMSRYLPGARAFGDSTLPPYAAVLYTPDTLWLMAAYAFGLSAWASTDLIAFFRDCPRYLPGLRRLGTRIAGSSGARAWVCVSLAGLWAGPTLLLLAKYVLLVGLFGDAMERFQTEPSSELLSPDEVAQFLQRGRELEVLSSVALAVGALVVYLVLLVPMIGYTSGLLARTLDGEVVDSARRADFIRRMRPALWLMFALATFGAGNILETALSQGLPIAKGLAVWVGQSLPAGLVAVPPDVASYALVGFALGALHYISLAELPFWSGQKALQVAESRRTKDQLRIAEQVLMERVRSNISEQEIVLPLARFTLAQEEHRRVRELPLHTITGAGDVVRKLSTSLLLSFGAAVITGRTPEAGKLVGEALRTIVEAFVK
jgi:hypothetical protein